MSKPALILSTPLLEICETTPPPSLVVVRRLVVEAVDNLFSQKLCKAVV
jgi:hypothetical protein